MLKYPVLLLVLAFLFSCGDSVRKKEIKSPDEIYGELFRDVQRASLFADSRTFATGIPKNKPEEILGAYAEEKTKPGFDLRKFVYRHFSIPEPKDTASALKDSVASSFAENLLTLASRVPEDDGGSLIPFRKDYISSDSRSPELFYKDAFFIMQSPDFPARKDMAENMVLNFAQLIQDFGHIPSANRSFYLSRSGPPYFAAMVDKLASIKEDEAIYEKYSTQLLREYQYWMASESKEEAIKQAEARTTRKKAYRKAVLLNNEQVLNRYFDELDTPRPEAFREDTERALHLGKGSKEVFRNIRAADESGWGLSSRWMKEEGKTAVIHTTEIIPVDLNALLYQLEITLARAYRKKGQDQYAKSMENLAAKRKAIFDSYFWDAQKGFYFDYDFENGKLKDHYTLAAVYPLYTGLASAQQAEKVAEVIKIRFLKQKGLLTTLHHSGQSWDAPYGWAALHWIAIEGLKKYGKNDLAEEIRTRWLQNNLAGYGRTGKLSDRYNVIDGSQPAATAAGHTPTAALLLRLMSSSDKK